MKTKTKTTRSRDRAQQVANGAAPARELLLLNEVTARTRLSDTTIWRLEKAGRFPKRVVIGFKRVAWRTTEIDSWISVGAEGWGELHAA